MWHFSQAFVVERVAKTVLVLAALVGLSGCWVISVHPLYEDVAPRDSDIVADKAMAGTWRFPDQKCEYTLTIGLNEDIYDLHWVQRGEGCGDSPGKSHYEARLIKLDSFYFLDVSPVEEDVCNFCIPVHQISLVKFDSDSLVLTEIDPTGLRKLLQTGAVDLKTVPEDPKESIFERAITLTALPKELKSFCRRYAADKTVFNPESSLVFKRAHIPS
ncbi:MAG TPA: hypothetical protein VFO39_13680 [Candidatus Sulfotelmatobacter sp.]|nr:hypothetical protein [Candidatus Sulfotelmatobacter sp.]